jgi:hypothetical protein
VAGEEPAAEDRTVSGGRLELVPCDPNDPDVAVTVTDPAQIAHDQTIDAMDAIRRPAGDYLHMPWRALDDLIGGVPPADLWYVGGFSGDGKTTMLTSLALDGVASGWRVYYLGLESRAHVIRTHFACKNLGLDAGDLLSGAYLNWHNAAEVREQVRLELKRQASAANATALRVSEAKHLTASVVRSEYLKASAYEVNAEILEMTQNLGVVTLAASQFNLDAIRGDRALRHLPPRENVWKFGNKKREVSSGQLAVYRPFRIGGVPDDEMRQFRAGTVSSREVCESNTMAAHCVKHRLYGAREGQRALLGVRSGRVMERSPSLPYSLR